MKKTLIALFATASFVAGVSAASAATSTGELHIDATLKKGCSVGFSQDKDTITFGTFSALPSDRSEHDQFRIDCTNGYASASVALNAGQHAGTANDTSTRQMQYGSDTLSYQVFQGNVTTSNGATVWGTDKDVYPVTIGGNVANGTEGYNDFTVILYKQEVKDKADGVYKDTLTATVTYDVVAASTDI